jgi:hypothetical protein
MTLLDSASPQRIQSGKSAAVRQLNAFINEVNAMIKSGRLAVGMGQGLIHQVERILSTLVFEPA